MNEHLFNELLEWCGGDYNEMKETLSALMDMCCQAIEDDKAWNNDNRME